jgi:multidrug efflux pump subunit AcrB
MIVPVGVIGALLATTLRGLENDVFFQIGLLTTVGLSAKNAILIVEFARELQDKQGMGPVDAALEAAPDHHDIARVHLWGISACYQSWCRLR